MMNKKQNEILEFVTKAELCDALRTGPLVPVGYSTSTQVVKCYFDKHSECSPYKMLFADGQTCEMGLVWATKKWRRYQPEPPKPRWWSKDIDADSSMGHYTFGDGYLAGGIMSHKNGIGIEVAEAEGQIFTSTPFRLPTGDICCVTEILPGMVKCTPVKVWFEAAE